MLSLSPENTTFFQTIAGKINDLIGEINGYLYTYILVALLIGTGLYFFIRSRALPLRLFVESIRVVAERPERSGELSSFHALMVSTASRVGVGNITGVASAIALGGPGAVFWMWVIATLGGASAFVESTLAQIYKKRGKTADDHSIGGPAYYIESALKKRWLAITFAVALITTYMGGFNLLASFNVAEAFTAYDWYTPELTPYIIGGILAVAMAVSIFGGSKRLTTVTSLLVPVMATIYIIVALFVIIVNWRNVPHMFSTIFSNAFDFPAIFGGFTGSAMMLGIKRGLYSNEAGVGSAPNAAASASVSHPVKQGLVQMLSVFIDTMIICTLTAFLILSSGIQGGEDLKGGPLVIQSMETALHQFALPFTTIALVLFAFTTIIGNFYYAEVNLRFLTRAHGTPQWLLQAFRAFAVVLVFAGALLDFSLAWNIGDLLMGCMALINLPVILLLGSKALACAKDYEEQKRAGVNPQFVASRIGITEKLDYWQ
ncbi:alanine/glycine:cation symporter family protein [Schaalia sp. lx-260]|uniref:alanine/glycine:cation symporter family protein n=1 Tax=Schaalia sp. lx-260 TaxID=2899082 RepID=UPI001E5347C0|nr:alanine/glycine:cation symporter family protein [Schaalia sp. lx-260]MCD4550306.1 alanine:cation symporter family protein [Schaalia sp. lx-260]